MNDHTGTGTGIVPELVNYTASGISLDWAFGEADIKHSITMELRPVNSGQGLEGFHLPTAEIIPTGQ